MTRLADYEMDLMYERVIESEFEKEHACSHAG
jgi:hypothetical protein